MSIIHPGRLRAAGGVWLSLPQGLVGHQPPYGSLDRRDFPQERRPRRRATLVSDFKASSGSGRRPV